MFSLAAKTHWKLALKAISKAIKVTFQDIIQNCKAMNYRNKIMVDLDKKRRVLELEEKLWQEDKFL